MGLFSKKSKSKTNESQQTQNTSTVTNNVPDWIADPSKQIAGNVSGILGQGPEAFTPQTGGLQNQAFQGAANLGANTGANFDQAREALEGAGAWSATNADAASLLDGGLDRYYNPFKDQVMNPVLSDYDEQSGMTRAAQAAAAAKNRAFQGSRYGIQEAQTEGQLARGRASAEGGLLSDMYSQATGLADSDAGRRQQTSLANAAAANAAAQANQQAALQRSAALAQLGLSEGAEGRANLGFQADLGATQTEQENAARQYPIQFQQQMGGLLQGLNPELFTGKTVDASGTMTGQSTTKNSSSDLMGTLGQAAQIAAMFSDKRLKRDVKTVGWDAKGRRWVSFAYVWEPLRRVFGVIAQEVLKSDPQAVTVGPGGYLMVNYGGLR